MGWNLLHCFLALRVAGAFATQTSFVPDEYWQSLEIAHRLVFGYGYTTWEWRTGLRSYLYPLIFAVLFKILRIFNADARRILILAPKILQGVFSAFGDYYICKFVKVVFGKESMKWTAVCLSTSWFLFYCSSRTVVNTMENALTSTAMYYYPWEGQCNKNHKKYFIFVALNCIIRPTAAIVWCPLCIYHLYQQRSRVIEILLGCYFPIGIISVCLATFLDSYWYGRWVFVPWEFLKYNVLYGQGSFYGSYPWHWYLTQGMPVILGSHIIFFILAIRKARGKEKTLIFMILWTVFIYSFITHKEFRFLLPIIPFAMCVIGVYLSKLAASAQKDHPANNWKAKAITVFLIVSNAPVAIYFGLFHQRGTLDVMQWLAEDSMHDHKMDVLFLMPCHSTPLYSHLHRNISVRFLTCEPNLIGSENYTDEADEFYQHPQTWLHQNFVSETGMHFPTHIVCFNVLRHRMKAFLESYSYELCATIFHGHFIEGRIGNTVEVHCKR